MRAIANRLRQLAATAGNELGTQLRAIACELDALSVAPARHPMQPLLKTSTGVIRFKRNDIVDTVYEWARHYGLGLNELARMNFSVEDRQQFAQLLGYSLSGYGTLTYVDDEAFARAEAMLGLLAQPAAPRISPCAAHAYLDVDDDDQDDDEASQQTGDRSDGTGTAPAGETA